MHSLSETPVARPYHQLSKQAPCIKCLEQIWLLCSPLSMQHTCRPCRGVLLFGPPGTGKTLLARAAAAECGASFLAIHPSTVASKWLGDGVRYMRAVFSLASKLSPCVLFIDEVDAMLAKRDSQREHEAHREIKNEFMAQWDGIRTGSSSSIDRVRAHGDRNMRLSLCACNT